MNTAFTWSGAWARTGLALRRYQRPLMIMQWLVVVAYAVLLIVPAFLPLPSDDATLVTDLGRLAQFVFWGVWWPFVILSVLLLGRSWCGLLCPEGFLTEWASRHGRGGTIPRWLRWPGWPLLAFILTTVYGQLISVYEYPRAALLILGGSTVAALAVGWAYGRGKRVWCRYLCPVSGVFGLLARVAPLHFAVDRDRWAAAPGRSAAVDCPPLLNVRQLNSNQHCQMCGRCAGHRDAVTLSWRSHAIEIVQINESPAPLWEARLLLFGVLGLATTAFVWTFSPWFVQLKQFLAIWLLEHGMDFMLSDNAPWWLLTHYPAQNDVFSWLDGLSILIFLAAGTLIIGGGMRLLLELAAISGGHAVTPHRLAMTLIPVGGANLFVGLSLLTTSQLNAEGWLTVSLNPLREIMLALALMLSLRLAWRLTSALGAVRRFASTLAVMMAGLLVISVWQVAWWQW